MNCDPPVTSRFFRLVESDLEAFLSDVTFLEASIGDVSGRFREKLIEQGHIFRLEKEGDASPVWGVDASSRSGAWGEMAVALSSGVAIAHGSDSEPIYDFKRVSGLNSETFNSVAGYLRVASELSVMRQAIATEEWVMYDGSLLSLNMDLCKFAGRMPKDLVNGSSDFSEWFSLREMLTEALRSDTSDWYSIFASQAIPKLFSCSKKGTSKYYSRQIAKQNNVFPDGYVPTDKLLFQHVLGDGEYSKPVPYDKAFEGDSHGSKVSGYGTPSKTEEFVHLNEQAVKYFEKCQLTYYRPFEWSTVQSVHFHESLGLENVLALVKGQVENTRVVMEPISLHLADLMSKQGMSALDLYGDINANRFRKLYSPTRTQR